MDIVFNKSHIIVVPAWKDFNTELEYIFHITSHYEGDGTLVIKKEGNFKKGYTIFNIDLQNKKLLNHLDTLESEYLAEPFQVSFDEKLISKNFLYKLKELFIEFKGKNKVLLNIKKNGKDFHQVELKSRFVDAGNEELLRKVMDAIEYATIVSDEINNYDDDAPF